MAPSARACAAAAAAAGAACALAVASSSLLAFCAGARAPGAGLRLRTSAGPSAQSVPDSHFGGAPRTSATSLCGALAVATLAVAGRAAARRRSAGRPAKSACNASRVFWWTSSGKNGPWTTRQKIKDWERRESVRRGEEDWRHDVDNLELTHITIQRSVGWTKRQKQGYRAYGGSKGILSRGRMHQPVGYQSGKTPLNLRLPKLPKDLQQQYMDDGMVAIKMKDLMHCGDGDEVDLMELRVRGIHEGHRNDVFKYAKAIKCLNGPLKWKVEADEEDEFSIKNLTVYAHKFAPAAKEKIENLGGRCIRLHEYTGLPIDADSMASAEFKDAPLSDYELEDWDNEELPYVKAGGDAAGSGAVVETEVSDAPADDAPADDAAASPPPADEAPAEDAKEE